MIVTENRRGYATVYLTVQAEPGEELTKEQVENEFSSPFGCHVMGGCGTFQVSKYLD